MASVPTATLNTGARIPLIAYGTWLSPPDQLADAVAYAIGHAGYRHIDCAWGYQNEAAVGAGIRAAGVPRSELFITSKLWGVFHRKVEEGLDQSLALLGVDYLDLYLMHWPIPLNPNGNHPIIPLRPDGTRDIDEEWDIRDTWKQLEAVLAKGKVKAIGVSNMSQKKLAALLPSCAVPPATDQLELHVYNPDHALVAFCKSVGVLPQAYSPLGSSGAPIMQDAAVCAIAAKHGATPADVLLGWNLAKGHCVITRSLNKERIASNITNPVVLAGKLTQEDMGVLDGLAAGGKQQRFVMPPWGVDLGLENWTAY